MSSSTDWFDVVAADAGGDGGAVGAEYVCCLLLGDEAVGGAVGGEGFGECEVVVGCPIVLAVWA